MVLVAVSHVRRRAALCLMSMSFLRPLHDVYSWNTQSQRASSPLRRFQGRAPSWPGFRNRGLFCGSSLKKRRHSPSLAVSTDSSSVPDVQVPRRFVPYPFQYRQELIARVTSLTNLGMGVCRVSVSVANAETNETSPTALGSGSLEGSSSSTSGIDTQEWVVFVPNAIPGELVQLRVYRNYKTYSDADLVRVIEPSDSRVEPVCPLSDSCGGCQYQHMSIGFQREWKTNHVRDVLQRIGSIENPDVSPTVGTEDVWHYRSKITPHYDSPRKVGENSYEIGKIGFKMKSSRQLLDVSYCHIATEAINDKLVEVRKETYERARTGQLRRPKRGATLLLRDADQGVITDHNTYVTTTVSDLSFRFLAGNFFQNNPYMVPVMVEHVVDAATAPARHGKQMTHLIDCYCGSGLFCLSSASSFDVCVGIEVNDKAVQEAYGNAALNGIENCDFVAASAEAIFAAKSSDRNKTDEPLVNVQQFPRDQTVVVVDPPRKGCSDEFLDQLYAFAPQRVVYMSCDPATQARDAKGLLANGYDLTSVQPFDLFPQTRHIECLITFERAR